MRGRKVTETLVNALIGAGMKRISSITLLLTCVSGLLYAGESIEITVIKSRDLRPYTIVSRAFKDHLNELNTDARIRECTLKGRRADDLLVIRAKIKAETPDLVLTLGTPATKLAQEVVKDVPALFTMVLDPKAGNVSPPGVVIDISPEVKLRQLKRILPNAKRVGLVYSDKSVSAYQKIAQAGARLGFEVICEKIGSGKELPEGFEDISWRIDCFLMIVDSKIYFRKSVEYLLREALSKKIPVVGLSSAYTKAGALISFDCDYEDLGKQTGEIALKLLSGVKSSDIGFVGPRRIDFTLNLAVAERLGIRIPANIRREAREVFGK